MCFIPPPTLPLPCSSLPPAYLVKTLCLCITKRRGRLGEVPCPHPVPCQPLLLDRLPGGSSSQTLVCAEDAATAGGEDASQVCLMKLGRAADGCIPGEKTDIGNRKQKCCCEECIAWPETVTVGRNTRIFRYQVKSSNLSFLFCIIIQYIVAQCYQNDLYLTTNIFWKWAL